MSQNGKILVQNIQLVLGLLYHVSIFQKGGEHLCKECRHLEHNLVLTRDRNKQFHIFQHTTRHSEQTLPSGSLTSDWFKNCTCPLLLSKRTQSLNKEEDLNTDRQEGILWSGDPYLPYSSHLNSPLHVVQMHKSEHCAANPDQAGGCKGQVTDKEYRLHPLRVVSYNIWNVNSLTGVEEGYDGRIIRLGKVRINTLSAIIFPVLLLRCSVLNLPVAMIFCTWTPLSPQLPICMEVSMSLLFY